MAQPELSTGRRIENASLVLALAALVLGFALGVILIEPPAPLFGGDRRSVGEVASLAGAGFAGLSFLIISLQFNSEIVPWYRDVGRLRRTMDLSGLILMQAILTLFGLTAVFAVFQQAFQQLELDVWASGVLIGLGCSVAAYIAAGTAGNLGTESLAMLVSGFLVVGAFSSALNASDELWWQAHFSALGTASDLAGITFNFTLVLTGLVVVTLAAFLTQDLSMWAAAMGYGRWRVTVVRWSFVVMGVMLGMVGLIPVSLSLFWHNFVTYVAVGAFAILLVGAPFLFPRLPGAFFLVTVVIAGMLGLALVLHFIVGYLNITAFEIIAVATVLVWMVLFIRTVVGAARDVAGEAPGVARRGPAEVPEENF